MKCPMCGNDDESSIEERVWTRATHEVKRGMMVAKRGSQRVYKCKKCGMTWTEGTEDIETKED